MNKYLKTFLVISLAFLLCNETGYAKDMVQIKGSDTLINLVQRLSEVYMEKNPGKAIAVTGGGSGTGIAAMINGKCDIANASRLMKPKEITMANDAGLTPKRVVVAIDGLSIIVNKTNPVSKLTVAQIGSIFRGEVSNWQEVGGDNKPITLYGRQSNSGTFDFMVEEVMKGDHSPKMRQMNGNAQIVEAVKADETGVGYVGVGYAKESKDVAVLNVAAFEGVPYASPLNTEEVQSGRYPISRPLNQYVNGSPKGEIRDFISFELSPEGQEIVEQEGFFKISEEYKAYNKKTIGI